MKLILERSFWQSFWTSFGRPFLTPVLMLIVGVSFELISTLILYVVWTIILDLILTMIFGGSGRDVEYGFDWNFEDNRGERVWSAWTWISIGFEFELHLQRRNLKVVLRKSAHECSNHGVLGPWAGIAFSLHHASFQRPCNGQSCRQPNAPEEIGAAGWQSLTLLPRRILGSRPKHSHDICSADAMVNHVGILGLRPEQYRDISPSSRALSHF